MPVSKSNIEKKFAMMMGSNQKHHTDAGVMCPPHANIIWAAEPYFFS
jgi:hypothetical protein